MLSRYELNRFLGIIASGVLCIGLFACGSNRLSVFCNRRGFTSPLLCSAPFCCSCEPVCSISESGERAALVAGLQAQLQLILLLPSPTTQGSGLEHKHESLNARNDPLITRRPNAQGSGREHKHESPNAFMRGGTWARPKQSPCHKTIEHTRKFTQKNLDGGKQHNFIIRIKSHIKRLQW